MAEHIQSRRELENPTPMMKQYLEVKDEYEGFVLLYRLGDFYECFFEDAVLASRVLELTLTSRDCGEGRRAAMCGVPFHKADLYVGRLVDKGYKVAICEQVEDPKSAVGLVRREVTRVVTPGTVTDGEILNNSTNNFLAAIAYGTSGVSVCFADISTGDVNVTYISGDDTELRLINELAAYQPSEAVINAKEADIKAVASFLTDKCGTVVNCGMQSLFSFDRARERVKSIYFSEMDKLSEAEMIMSVGAVLSYVNETQKTDVAFAKDINVYSRGEYLDIDLNSRRSLELVETLRNKEKRGSLIHILDKTKTAMGARLLRSWMLRPLLNPVKISKRQSAVSDVFKNRPLREELFLYLSDTLDLERLCAKAVYGTANAKDLRTLYLSIVGLPEIKSLILNLNANNLKAIASSLDTLDDLAELLGRAIDDNPPLTVREGKMIRKGFDADVDYYRSIRDGGTGIMKSIEDREREETGIKNLKVEYNKVFGYFIEVTKSQIDLVPERYIRKQTLTNCERYITQELKEMETTVLSAEDKLVSLEYEIFTRLRGVVTENNERIRKTAALIAELDVYCSFAEVADKNSYVCPEVDTSFDLIIKDGRHPVVEKFVSGTYFVPNDTTLDVSANRLMLITGPNMAGKSTYMRQVAIITLLAQIGSFVPAREARIGIVDKIFTRVGASDDLASGQSTFMLEMNEVAFILNNATKRSLIIYDEVGRGTSTYDGMAIARAVVEYTHSKKIGAKTLFATHYHELTALEDDYEGVVNYNIAAKKRGDTLIFLRKIVRGGTDDSYGIEVAKLAGVPTEVVKRAREILNEIESGSTISLGKGAKPRREEPDLFTSIAMSRDSEVTEKLREIDINTITPIEAMNTLFELKKMLD